MHNWQQSGRSRLGLCPRILNSFQQVIMPQCNGLQRVSGNLEPSRKLLFKQTSPESNESLPAQYQAIIWSKRLLAIVAIIARSYFWLLRYKPVFHLCQAKPCSGSV
jgi:hypothetical protein